MQFEFLYFAAANAEPANRQLAGLLKSRGSGDRINLMRVTDEQAEVRRRFVGSPTVRIDGEDIEPGASVRTDYGIGWRMFLPGE